MSLDGRFKRIGGSAQLRVLNDECIELQCWDPQPLMHGKREIYVCLTRTWVGCPIHGLRGPASDAAIRDRRRMWRVDP